MQDTTIYVYQFIWHSQKQTTQPRSVSANHPPVEAFKDVRQSEVGLDNKTLVEIVDFLQQYFTALLHSAVPSTEFEPGTDILIFKCAHDSFVDPSTPKKTKMMPHLIADCTSLCEKLAARTMKGIECQLFKLITKNLEITESSQQTARVREKVNKERNTGNSDKREVENMKMMHKQAKQKVKQASLAVEQIRKDIIKRWCDILKTPESEFGEAYPDCVEGCQLYLSSRSKSNGTGCQCTSRLVCCR